MAENAKRDHSDTAEITTTDEQASLTPFHLQSDLHTESVDDLLDYLMGVPLLDPPARSLSDVEDHSNGTTGLHVEENQGGGTSVSASEARYKPGRHTSFTDDRGHKVAKFTNRPEGIKDETEGLVGDGTVVHQLSETSAGCDQPTQQTMKLHPTAVDRTPEAAWTESEIKQLSKLVASFKAGQGIVDWTTIGSFMSRAPESCRDKWSSLVHDEVPLGPYSVEEDALILRRVSEWGNKGNGLWVSLQNEMGRSSSSLNGRWRTLKKRKGRGTALP